MPMPVSETANSTKLLPLLTLRAASLTSPALVNLQALLRSSSRHLQRSIVRARIWRRPSASRVGGCGRRVERVSRARGAHAARVVRTAGALHETDACGGCAAARHDRRTRQVG